MLSCFRLSAVAALTVLALSACGGGSSLPGGGAAAQALGRERAQTIPDVTNPYPFVQGDVFNFAYADTIVTTTGKTAVKSYVDGTVTTTVGPLVEFDKQKLTQLSDVFTYTDSDSSHQTTGTGTLTTDYYREFASVNGGLDYDMYGLTTSGNESDSNGSSIVTATSLTYDSPYLIDVIPEVKSSWNEDIPEVQTSQTTTTTNGNVNEESYTFTRNSDLSYTRAVTFDYNGSLYCKASQSAAKDGSGEDTNDCPKDTYEGTTTFAAPVKSGTKYTITVVYTPVSGSKTTTQVPDWFPGGGAVKALVTDTKADKGTVKVPATCGKATAGQTAVELVESVAHLDPVLGTYDTETQTSYVVAGEGRVCAIDKYKNDTYDNHVTGTLTSSVTYTSITGLTSESLKQLRVKGLVLGFAQSGADRGRL